MIEAWERIHALLLHELSTHRRSHSVVVLGGKRGQFDLLRIESRGNVRAMTWAVVVVVWIAQAELTKPKPIVEAWIGGRIQHGRRMSVDIKAVERLHVGGVLL